MKPNHDRSKPRPRPNHDLKPTGANSFKKNHHRSHNPTMTNDQRPTSATDPRPTTHFIPARRSTTNDPLQPPIHDQRPASSQLADPRPRPNHADPQPTTTPKTTTTTDPCRHQTHNPTTNHDQRPKHRTQQRRKREGRERRDGVWSE